MNVSLQPATRRRARTPEKLLEIVHEDHDLLVVNKPADLVCHPTKAGPYSSLISRARLHVGAGAEPQLINRLDRETSGIVLLAKTTDAARALRKIWEDRAVCKEYVAIVHGHVAVDDGVIDAPLGKDETSAVAIKDCVRPDGSPAQTEFRVAQRFVRTEGNFSVLGVAPRTGRKHQIRIHLAHLGHAIVGDKIYGLDEQIYLALVGQRLTAADRARLLLPNHALHAARVSFVWQGVERNFAAPPETWFNDFIAGGRPVDSLTPVAKV
ncbi:MAG: RluA family pseudouridine synthase [Verrucomicrobia bacterium]|nr:RluA family pseudouridine synthase [Verrucomicrobiota bacterium]